MIAVIITFLLPYLYILLNNKFWLLLIYIVLYSISFYIASDYILKKLVNILLDKNENINLYLKLSIIYLFLVSNIPILIYNYPIFLLSLTMVVILYTINIFVFKLFNKYVSNKYLISNYLKECYLEKDTALNKGTVNIRIDSFKKYLKRYKHNLFKRLFYSSIIYLINFIYVILIIYLLKDFTIVNIILTLYMSVYSYLFIKYLKYIKGYYKIFKHNKEDNKKRTTSFKKITLKNISIPNLVTNFNLTINNNDKIYIIGENKDYTPLLNTLLNKNNYLGKITVDRKDIKNIDLSALLMLDYNNLWFKESTIIDNILYNKVLNSKNFHQLINTYLPNNFIESFINEEGTEIKNVYDYPIYYQRLITFMRSINTDKDIIILDKPFNNLSKYNQNIMEKELAKLNKTIVIFSNTPPTLDSYSKILLLENLLIKEEGTYNELIKEKRDFYRLINR